ncbi:MAG: type I restriction enzyme HsdR N-terminal domain-containing protein [Balneolaceae bacterium]|nr:type I restriction enzyme HsdR N-terminal domain-containing protein [Balneolaceae bacterium]MCH8549198.1 type I restriction enzyme HsdR N-terminal domain-containing protein [Balneolaceae bacterium]
MKSIAFQHFPRLIEEGGERLLFNPVQKKRAKNRPEERVRLRWVEYLLHQTDQRKSRIGFEAPVKLRQDPNSVRADLVLYSDNLTPEILIECKAETIPLTEATAEQAARYNSKLDAKYICLTNGVSDFWFEADSRSSHEIESPLTETSSIRDVAETPSWWAERGFCSPEMKSKLSEKLTNLLIRFWYESGDSNIRYLGFDQNPLNIPMNHYYRMLVRDDLKMAVTFTGGRSHETSLIAVLNRNGRNVGLMSANLKGILDEKESPVRIISKRGDQPAGPGELGKLFEGDDGLDESSYFDILIPFFD